MPTIGSLIPSHERPIRTETMEWSMGRFHNEFVYLKSSRSLQTRFLSNPSSSSTTQIVHLYFGLLELSTYLSDSIHFSDLQRLGSVLDFRSRACLSPSSISPSPSPSGKHRRHGYLTKPKSTSFLKSPHSIPTKSQNILNSIPWFCSSRQSGPASKSGCHPSTCVRRTSTTEYVTLIHNSPDSYY